MKTKIITDKEDRKELEIEFIKLMLEATNVAIEENKIKRFETHRDGMYLGFDNCISPSFKTNSKILLQKFEDFSLRDKELKEKIVILNNKVQNLDFTYLTPKDQTIGSEAIGYYFRNIRKTIDKYNSKK